MLSKKIYKNIKFLIFRDNEGVYIFCCFADKQSSLRRESPFPGIVFSDVNDNYHYVDDDSYYDFHYDDNGDDNDVDYNHYDHESK